MHRGYCWRVLYSSGSQVTLYWRSGRRAPVVESIAEKIISRLMGLLLAALAVQFMLNALRADEGMLGRLTGTKTIHAYSFHRTGIHGTLTVHYKEEGTMTLKKSMIAGTSLLACTHALAGLG